MQTLHQAAASAAQLAESLKQAADIAGTLEQLGVIVKSWRHNGRRVVLQLSSAPPIACKTAVIRRQAVGDTAYRRETYAALHCGLQLEWSECVATRGGGHD